MTEVKQGQLWAENDPRVAGRVIQIARVMGPRVSAVTVRASRTAMVNSLGRRSSIALDRIPAKFTLIQDEHGTQVFDTPEQEKRVDQLLNPMKWRGELS